MHPLKVVRIMIRLTKLVTGYLNLIQLAFWLLFAIPIAVVAAVSRCCTSSNRYRRTDPSDRG
jgi:hypothetical protein